MQSKTLKDWTGKAIPSASLLIGVICVPVLAVTCDGGCWNGGECIAVNGVAKCICPSSWTGSKCQEGLFMAVSYYPVNTTGQSHQMEPLSQPQLFISSGPLNFLNAFSGSKSLS